MTKADISSKAIGRYENGNRVPSVKIAESIASALGISVNELLYPDSLRVNVPIDIFNLNLEELQAKLDIRSDKISGIIKDFDKLNEAGQLKLMEYAKDLTRIPDYKLSRKDRANRDAEDCVEDSREDSHVETANSYEGGDTI